MEKYKLGDLEELLEEITKKANKTKRNLVMYTGVQGMYNFDKALVNRSLSEYMWKIAPVFIDKIAHIPGKGFMDILSSISKVIKELENEV